MILLRLRVCAATLLLSVSGCTSARVFESYARPAPGLSGLYILRPNSPMLALYSFDLDLYKYPDHFSKGGETKIKNVSLQTGQYVYWNLAPGFYMIHLNDLNQHQHIVLLKENTVTFRSIEIFNRTPLSLPDIRLIESDSEEAAESLIAAVGRMEAHPQSEDR